ncbi:hypothetical protein WDW89_26375 [Deltaproteobacteria bacterium TL4]
MADWQEAAIRSLLEIAKNNTHLAHFIRIAIESIEQNPQVGQQISNNLWVYTQTKQRFQIGYHYAGVNITLIEIGWF